MEEFKIHHYNVETKLQSEEGSHRGSLPPMEFKIPIRQIINVLG